MTLYEIDSRIAELCEQVDPETGELLIDEEALEELQMEREAKLENIALAIKNITAESKAIKSEIEVLQARKKTADNQVDSLKQYLTHALGGEKFKTPKVAVSFTHSKAVVTEDGFIEWAKVNNDSLLNYSEPTVNKKVLGNLLKAGQQYPFAKLEERENVQIK